MAITVAPVPLAYYHRPTRKKLNIVHGRGGSKSGKALGGGGTGEEAPLASREIIDPGVVGISDEDMQDAVTKETQQPIEARGGRAIYTPGSIMDIITSGHSNRANPNYDPSQAIGGENVPYKPATGIGGWFRRAFMGDSSNTDNIAAQQQQGRAWAAADAARKAKEEGLAAEDRAFGRQKELIGMQDDRATKAQQAAEAIWDKRLAGMQAIQDSKEASAQSLAAEKLASDTALDEMQFMDKATLAAINNQSKEGIASETNETKKAVAQLISDGKIDAANALMAGRITLADINNAAKAEQLDKTIAGAFSRAELDSKTRQAIATGKNDTGLAIQKLRNLGIQVKPGNMINPELFSGKSPYMFSPADPFTHSAGGFGPVDGSGDSLGGQLKGPGNPAAFKPGAKAANQIQVERAVEGALLDMTPEEKQAWEILKARREGRAK